MARRACRHALRSSRSRPADCPRRWCRLSARGEAAFTGLRDACRQSHQRFRPARNLPAGRGALASAKNPCAVSEAPLRAPPKRAEGSHVIADQFMCRFLCRVRSSLSPRWWVSVSTGVLGGMAGPRPGWNGATDTGDHGSVAQPACRQQAEASAVTGGRGRLADACATSLGKGQPPAICIPAGRAAPRAEQSGRRLETHCMRAVHPRQFVHDGLPQALG